MASKASKRRPGRPRIHPTPVKLGIRFRPDLFLRMDAYLKRLHGAGKTTTQREFIESAVEAELDRVDPQPKEHTSDRASTPAGAPAG